MELIAWIVVILKLRNICKQRVILVKFLLVTPIIYGSLCKELLTVCCFLACFYFMSTLKLFIVSLMIRRTDSRNVVIIVLSIFIVSRSLLKDCSIKWSKIYVTAYSQVFSSLYILFSLC